MILASFGFYHIFVKVTDDSCRKRERGKGKSKKIELFGTSHFIHIMVYYIS